MINDSLPCFNLLTRLSLGSIGILIDELRRGLTTGTPPLASTYVSHHIAMLAKENIIAAKLLQTVASHHSASSPEWFPGFVKECLKDIHDNMVRYTDSVPYDNYDNEYKRVLEWANERGWDVVDVEPYRSGTVSLIFELKNNDDNGKRAVAKIVRGGVDGLLRRSIKEVKPLVHLLEYWSGTTGVLKVANDIFDSLNEQTDLRKEAESCRRFREILENLECVSVPDIIDVVSNNIVVYEFFDGKPVTKLENLDRANKKHWTKSIVKSVILSALVEGVVHGDLHSGNLLFNEETKKMAIVDFGVVYSAPTETKERIQRVLDLLLKEVEDGGSVSLTRWIAVLCVRGLFEPYEYIDDYETEGMLEDVENDIQELSTQALTSTQNFGLLTPSKFWNHVRGHIGFETITLNEYGMKMWQALLTCSGIIHTLCDYDDELINEAFCEAARELFQLDLLQIEVKM
jgi:predicted Ser/Thr protein kinase